MEQVTILSILSLLVLCIVKCNGDAGTVLSAVLTPDKTPLLRQERSYYERYGYGRPYDRLDDRPSKCGRCDDDDDDDYDRGRDRDDDRRPNRPTYGNRHDRNKNYNDDNDDRRYDNDRKSNKNGTEADNDDKKRPHDDEDDDRPHSGKRNKHKNRYDDRDRYRPDYYDRFLRDPYRDRYERPYYDDPYSRRPYDRNPYQDRYDDYSGGRYDGGSAYRRPYYDDRYDRGNGYDDFGGYGPGVGRGPHDSFRPWDETYRGQAGWDAGGRGYYFASGRPDSTGWGQRDYARPTSGGSWQNVAYTSGYSGTRDPVYRGSGYGSGYQDLSVGYGQSSGWQNVGERRPYRDQRYGENTDLNYQGYGNGYQSTNTGYGSSGWQNVGERRPYRDQRFHDRDLIDSQGYRDASAEYGRSSGWQDVGFRRPCRDQSGVAHIDSKVTQVQDTRYGQNRQPNTHQPGTFPQSTTLATSYLFQREDELVTKSETTATPSKIV